MFTKLVTNRRGGYCFEQNTLLEAVLGQIGFRDDSLIPGGDVRFAGDVQCVLNHGARL